MPFGPSIMNIGLRSERQTLPAEMNRAAVVAAGNSNAVVAPAMAALLDVLPKKPSVHSVRYFPDDATLSAILSSMMNLDPRTAALVLIDLQKPIVAMPLSPYS